MICYGKVDWTGLLNQLSSIRSLSRHKCYICIFSHCCDRPYHQKPFAALLAVFVLKMLYISRISSIFSSNWSKPLRLCMPWYLFIMYLLIFPILAKYSWLSFLKKKPLLMTPVIDPTHLTIVSKSPFFLITWSSQGKILIIYF